MWGGGLGLAVLGHGAKRTKRPPEAAEAPVPPAASNAAAKAAVLRGRGAAASAVRVVSRPLATVWLQPAASPLATARCTRLTRDTSHSGKEEGEVIASCSPPPACSSCTTGERGERCGPGEGRGQFPHVRTLSESAPPRKEAPRKIWGTVGCFVCSNSCALSSGKAPMGTCEHSGGVAANAAAIP